MRRFPTPDEPMYVQDAGMAHPCQGDAMAAPRPAPPPHYLGHRERLRERFFTAGADALSDYELLEQWHRKRYLVLPGMTGLWQIAGRSDLSFDDLVRLDFYYLENWSIWLDISILLRTIPAVIAGRGAY